MTRLLDCNYSRQIYSVKLAARANDLLLQKGSDVPVKNLRKNDVGGKDVWGEEEYKM